MKNVEDLYPLSPMQRLMLIHSLTHPDNDVLFNQFQYDILGELEPDALESAWRELVQQHSVLRTAFVWKDLEEPLQAVRRSVEMPFERNDLGTLSRAEQENRLAALLEADRRKGFPPSRAPLMRVQLVRLGRDRHRMIWSCHHLLLDRWCIAPLLEHLSRAYRARLRGDANPVRSGSRYRNYIDWIQRQDPGTAQAFWRNTLEGLQVPPPLAKPSDHVTSAQIELTGPAAESIRTYARTRRLTVGTVFQGAWALVLNSSTHHQDVVFGTAVAARPNDLADVETMIGSFVNNVPLRITLPADEPVHDWLKRMQRQREERAPYDHVATSDIQAWAGLPAGQPLFDSLVVWLSRVDSPPLHGFELRAIDGNVETAYPISLVIAETAQGYRISLTSRSDADASTLLALLEQKLRTLVVDDGGTLGNLEGFAKSSERPGEATTHRPFVSIGVSAGTTAAKGREPDDRASYEQILQTEMRSILGTEQCGLDDDFFDLGGNSLRAVQLHERVTSLTGIAVPLLSLLASPTARAMATVLQQRQWPLQAGIVRAIRPTGTRPPLFCIASPEVNTVGYVNLTRHLDPAQPVYVLQAPPSNDLPWRINPSEMPGFGAAYVDALLKVQPEGSVRLLGMCGGSHIALEMARRLRGLNRTVEFVGVVNTWALHTLSWRVHIHRYLNGVRWSIRQRLRRKSLRRPPPDATPNGNGNVAQEDEWFKIDWPHLRPDRPKYAGTITVFRLRKQQRFRIRDSRLGWGMHAERVELHHLAGKDHLSILREPNAALIAERLQATLSQEAAR